MKNRYTELHFTTIDSTSTYIKNNLNSLCDLTFVSADEQTNGHGRSGRKWESSKSENLMFSLLLKNKESAERFSSVSLLTAVSVLTVLQSYGVKNVQIKWPNDVYVGDRKMCGILLESRSDENGIAALIVGVGINVNETFFSSELNATSICLELGKKISVEKLKQDVYDRLFFDIDMLLNGKSDYLTVLRKNNYLQNKTVFCNIKGEIKQVKVIGVNDDNSLSVVSEGETLSVYSDEVTFHIDSRP